MKKCIIRSKSDDLFEQFDKLVIIERN